MRVRVIARGVGMGRHHAAPSTGGGNTQGCISLRRCRTGLQHSTLKEIEMNSDQVKGAVKGAAGTVQRKAGEVMGNTAHRVKGTVKEAEGKVQKAFGDAKEVHRKR